MCADSNTVFHRVEELIITKENEMVFTMQTRTLITCSVAIVLFAGIASQQSYSQERKAVNLSPTRGLPFSDGIVVGDTLYVAGQEGTDESNKLAAGGIGPETTAALENIQKVLKAAGFELKDIVHRQCHSLSRRHS